MRTLRIFSLALPLALLFCADADANFNGTLKLKVRLPATQLNPDPGPAVLPRSDQEQNEYFNLANCTCGAPFFIEAELQGGAANMTDVVQPWYGTNCGDNLIRQNQNLMIACEKELGVVISDVFNVLLPKPTLGPFFVNKLMGPNGQACPTTTTRDTNVYFLSDDNMDETQADRVLKIKSDAFPPSQPTNIRIAGGEATIRVSWEPSELNAADVDNYQLLCMRADGTTVASDNFGVGIKPEYLTTTMLGCGANDGVRPVPPTGLPDNTATLPAPLLALSPGQLCASGTKSATSLSASGLQNGAPYRVVLLVTDEALNVTALDLGVATPTPSVDFWELYRMQGGTAEGGCESSGPSGLIFLGVIGLCAFVLRRRKLTALVVLLLCVASTPARAQDYWQDEEESGPALVGRVPASHWNIELKGGPYYPDVDQGAANGAYRLMYGGKRSLISKITTDFYFFTAIGQLGLTASIGYTSKSADAFVADAAGNPVPGTDSGFMRAPGDKNSFRIMPMAIGLAYRFTLLDDYYKLPLVPYAKASLAYYMWWVKKANGKVARVSTDPTCNLDINPMCPSERALGGSMGFEGVVGVAIRAERLDPDAAMSLRTDLGVEHAGLFAEFMYADVDGFGSNRKMSVGDKTWLVGINFEF